MPFNLAADTTKLCRVCMTAKEGHRTDLYDAASFVSGQPSLHGMLKAVCAPVFDKSEDDDVGGPSGMPTKVCAVCRNATIAAFKLHQMCIDTELRLGQLLALKRELQDGLEGGENNEACGDPLKNSKETLEPTLQDQQSIPEEKHGYEVESREHDQSHDYVKDLLPNSDHEDTIKVEELDLVDEAENEDHASESVEHQEPAATVDKAKRICQICKETFEKAFLLRNHMTQKHQLYMCEICHETFGSLSWFVRHKAMKHKRRPVCINCGEKFATKVDLKNHHLQGSCSEKISECPICKETFPTRVALYKHRVTHRIAHKCSICDVTSVSKAHLELHMRRHMGVKELACNNCPMRFHTKIELESHMLTHTKTKNAICDICGSRFTKKESLKMHVKRVHEGYRPHECSLCGLKFSLRCQLKRHMYTHTGEKPYKCQLCTQAYAQTNDLVKHVARVHGLDKPYQCDRCNEAFRLLTDLRQHYRVHVQSTEGGAEHMEEVRFTSVAILQRAFARDKQLAGE